MSSAANEFRQVLKLNNDFARAIDEPGFPLSGFVLIQDWQRQRFQLTYADYLARESDRPACQFFLDELYGGLGFRERDEDVNRVAPIMSRLLPDKALRALSDALKLQLISLELDLAMATELQKQSLQHIDKAAYVEIYQSCGRRPDREQQIGLIRKLGLELIVLTDMPVLLGLVKAVRKPALAAGFGRLQGFLEQGLSSFRQLQDPTRFVEVIYQRETQLMKQWFEGSQDPVQKRVIC